MDALPLVQQSTSHAPAQPTYIFRGHTAQIHAVHFLRNNLRLLSADAEGWIVLWSITFKRPVAVWRAHKASVIGLGSWNDDRIITHGRDNKLCVWQLREEDEHTFSKTLPTEDSDSERPQPWLLHSLHVNALNFCSFAMCRSPQPEIADGEPTSSIMIAIPGINDGTVHVTSLPSEERVASIPAPKDIKTGMVMATRLHYQEGQLHILAGYESGYVCAFAQNSSSHWEAIYTHKAHTQPVLSLATAPSLGYFYSSSADAIITRHPLVPGNSDTKSVQTKHAGQQSLNVRSDGKIIATAGWDGRVRVYSAKTLKELAVLKWHKEGCYGLTFADVSDGSNHGSKGVDENTVTKRDLTVSEQRVQKAKETHWLAAGSKDGKVSLWDVY